MNEIEEIKGRIDLVDLAKGYMTLRQAGRNFKAICPFHQEKTPSLMIAPDKQIWHCFGCGEGGDIFTLVQKMEGVDFYDSLKLLAEKAGVELQKNEGFTKHKQQLEQIKDINGLAAEFYFKALKLSKSGQIAREYVQKRGLNDSVIQKFKIGYAPDLWEALSSFLQKRNFSTQQIVEAGLGIFTKKGTVVDRFRQRLMFPIWETNGKVVGFTGRVLRETDNPKYLNTSATKAFDKSKLWYALNFAKNIIRDKKEVLVGEGQMDVIACHQYGFENAICSSGTAITLQQIIILKRIADTIILAFDKDEAGKKAGYKLTGMALEVGMQVKIVDLGKYKDPDEMIRSDLEGWKRAINDSKGFVDYFLEAFDKENKEAKDKSKLADQIIPLVYQVKDQVERGHYLSLLAEKLKIDEKFVVDKFNLYQPAGLTRDQQSLDSNQSIRPEERLVGLIIVFWKWIAKELNDLQLEYFPDKIKETLNILQKRVDDSSGFDWRWLADLSADQNKRWQLVAMEIEKDYTDIDIELITSELGMLKQRIKLANQDLVKQALENKIKEAESNGDRKQVVQYIKQLQDLIIKGN